MKKTVFGCLGAAAVVFALQFTSANAQAALFSACNPCDEVACDPCDPCGDSNACNPCDAVCGTKAGKWFLNGHMEAGFFANGHGNKSTYTGNYWYTGRGADYDSGNSNLLQNTRLTGAQINQVYISMGKSVDGRRGLDIGGTVDFTWGSDAYFAQARGMEFGAGHGLAPDEGRWGTGDYYAAFAQAYVEAEWGRWNVKAGKFYAPFGIDSYKSTDNFFYSWSPTAYMAPHTAGGAYVTYTVNSQLAVLGGWAMPDEFGESSKNNVFLGGFIWTPSKRFSLSYTFATGENTYDPSNTGYHNEDLFVNSLGATVQINKRLKYVFDWTLLNVNGKAPRTDRYAVYSIMNELIYQYNKKWAFGARFGVLNDNDWETDWYTISLGANWTPNKWLTVKPELRYDWMGDGNTALFNNSENTYQFSGGMSAVVKF